MLTDYCHYIFVLTPERLLYLLISYPNININYLFIDEAHKISARDGRSAFYYKVVDMLAERPIKPHIIFASPNIPNPEVYLKLVPGAPIDQSAALSTSYSPVSQLKYLVDLVQHRVQLFNERKQEMMFIKDLNATASIPDTIKEIISHSNKKQSIVYFNSRDTAIEYAVNYADSLHPKNDPVLDALAKEMLDYLFHHSEWKDHIAFKGGTSLSKAYGLIERFSEDIDLILDWRVLGYVINEPWEERSNTKQDIFNKEANTRAEVFLHDTFLPSIVADLTAELGENIRCFIDENDPQTVKIAYPNSFADMSILQEIRLEIGALAAWTPVKSTDITPYAAQEYGRLFTQPSTNILTVLPERTFWEKVTILHREAFRSKERPFPSRYSRHYYDLYRMMQTEVKNNALADNDLLTRVVDFKDKFYRCPWARYDLAKRGTMRLMPPEYNLNKLRADYEHMQNMLFGNKPSFDEILDGITKLEMEINQV